MDLPEVGPQPIPESALLTGPLEPTNDADAIAKVAGIVAIKSYRAQHGRRWISAGQRISMVQATTSTNPARTRFRQ